MKTSIKSAAKVINSAATNHTTEETSSSNLLPRRSFLRRVGLGAALLAPGAAFLSTPRRAFGNNSGAITNGDAAMLRFAAAAELIETDFWVQYNELGGVQDSEEPNGTGNPAYTAALSALDDDNPQYIHDNTDDEKSHAAFLNAYLLSKGHSGVNLDQFRTLPGSTATGSSGRPRLTNLTQLTLDTSWYTRYRSANRNPDLDPNFVFPQAIPTLNVGQHTAIPRTDSDTTDPNFLQAIVNTAAFHFPTIEQGGSTLYPAMAQRATSVEVLRILISIGPTENMHFQTWSDIAGDAPPLTAVDPVTGVSVTFPDLNSPPFGGEEFSTNLIMPEPCPFLSRDLPPCSVVRPTNTAGVAMNVVNFLTDMGLFIGQPPAFFNVLRSLAQAADAARRGV
ncbi:MAG TPA: ferritin-like domain-containing protein [Chthoniobacterales bacterium]|nr:ferritin-like domain-containing protein [Chthoniobacterales bacterium]